MLALSAFTSTSKAFTPIFARAARPANKASRSASSGRVCSALSMADMTPEEYIKVATSENDVVIFSKSYCPFCTSTKNLFSQLGSELGMTADPFVVELDEMGPSGGEIQGELAKMTGQRTVPNVFVKGKHLGGNDDTQRAAADGTLAGMLK